MCTNGFLYIYIYIYIYVYINDGVKGHKEQLITVRSQNQGYESILICIAIHTQVYQQIMATWPRWHLLRLTLIPIVYVNCGLDSIIKRIMEFIN